MRLTINFWKRTIICSPRPHRQITCWILSRIENWSYKTHPYHLESSGNETKERRGKLAARECVFHCRRRGIKEGSLQFPSPSQFFLLMRLLPLAQRGLWWTLSLSFPAEQLVYFIAQSSCRGVISSETTAQLFFLIKDSLSPPFFSLFSQLCSRGRDKAATEVRTEVYAKHIWEKE